MSASHAATMIKDSFTDKSFGIGLVMVAAILGALAGWAFVNGDKIVIAKLDTMPAHTVLIEWNTSPVQRPVIPAPVAVSETVEDVADQHDPLPPDTTDVTAATDAVPAEDAPTADNQEDLAATTPVVMNPVAILPPVPFPGLFEQTAEGRLPVIRGSDNMTPFNAYRRPFDKAAAGDKPIVSIAVYDLGLSDSATEAALRSLPDDVSLVLSPYTTATDFWVQQARENGHEIWLSLPIEGADYPLTDPGPHTALIGAAERENIARLHWVMGRLPAYVGFVSPRQPTFLKSQNDMRPYIGGIYQRGLAFFDGSENPSLIPQTMAQGMNAPYGTIDVWVDAPATKEDIAAALARIEKLAHEQNYVAAIIRPYPLSYQMVQEWIKTLPEKGIVLAPLSAQTGM